MSNPNEFWLNLHRLSDSLRAEGLTSEERSENILQQFESMAPIARREVLTELSYLTLELTDLRVIVTARANAIDRAPARPPAQRAS